MNQDIKLEFLHHQIKFHPDHLKSVWENEASSEVKTSDILILLYFIPYKMVQVNGANKHGR